MRQSGGKPRVLYLSHHSPWPTFSGGRLREAQMVPRLLDHAKIDLVAVTRTREADEQAARDISLPGLTIKLFDDEAPPGVAPGRDSAAARDYLGDLARQWSFSAVHVEGHYLFPLLPEELRRRALVVEHNIESTLLLQRESTDPAIPVAWSEILRVRRQEEAAWREAAGVVALTAEDAATISRQAPEVRVHTVPSGWDHIGLRRPSASSAARPGMLRNPRLLFLANYAYPPNEDGVRWLLEKIFPRIQARCPRARLRLAGANLNAVITAQARRRPGVEVVGWVPAVEDELDHADVVLCPLRIGGGIKIKTIEALRRGCLVVSTSIGAQGLSNCLRSTIAIADNADSFAAHVVRLCQDDVMRQDMAYALYYAQQVMPTWDAAAARIGQLWMDSAQDWMDPVEERFAHVQRLQSSLPAVGKHFRRRRDRGRPAHSHVGADALLRA